MRIRNITAAAVVALSSGITTLALAGPARAQAFNPCPAAQPPGRTPGNPTTGPATGRPTQYPPGKCELLLSQSVVAAGGSLQAAGGGFAPGQMVEVSLSGASVPLASTRADGAGAFSTNLEIPASTAPGSYTVTASGGAQVLSASLQVTPAGSRPQAGAGAGGSDAQAAGQNLPRTGSSSPLPLALAGGTLTAVGLGAVVVARRRAGAVETD